MSRPVAPSERFSLARHTLRMYSGICIVIRLCIAVPEFDNPEVCQDPSSCFADRVVSAANAAATSAIQKFPKIASVVSSPNCRPTFHPISTATPLPVQFQFRSTDTMSFPSEFDTELWEKIEHELNTFFDLESESEYLWRVTLLASKLKSNSSVVDVLFTIHHCLADGLSANRVAKAFCSDFATALCNPLIASETNPLEEPFPDFPLETLLPHIKPTLWSLMELIGSDLLKSLGISKNHSYKSDFKPDPFSPANHPVKVIPIRIPNVSRIHAACIAQNTTVHALLSSCLIAAAAKVFNIPSKTEVQITHAASSRDLHPQATFGVFVHSIYTLTELDSSYIWDMAKSVKRQLISNRQAGLKEIGLLSLLQEPPASRTIENWAEKKVASFDNNGLLGTSNIGLQDWKSVDADGNGWSVHNNDVWFTSSLWPGSEIILLNVIGIKEGDLFCVLHFRKDWFVHEEMVRKVSLAFKETVEKII